MSSGSIKEKDGLRQDSQIENYRRQSEVLVNSDLMNDAVDGENHEHAEGIWAGFKSHPWACLWAFIMCFTIVSLFPRTPHFGLPH